jgi:hypothetical protein
MRPAGRTVFALVEFEAFILRLAGSEVFLLSGAALVSQQNRRQQITGDQTKDQ